MSRKFLPLMFLAPDGVITGGAAVIDASPVDAPPSQIPPTGEPDLPSVGDVYKQTMAKLSANPELADPDEDDDDEPVAPPPPKPVKPKKTETPAPPTEPEKQPELNAVDAALEETPAPEAAKDEDYLADLPEVLPKENRKDHWTKAREKIAKVAGLLKERDTKLAAIEKQNAERGTPPAEWEGERTELKKENDELRDAITAINIEYHPDTQKRFVQGRVELVRKASEKAKAFGGSADLIVQAMGEPEGRVRSDLIEQALGDLKETERSRVLHFIAEVEKLDDEKFELTKDPQGAWAKLQQAEKARETQRKELIEKNKRTVFDSVLGELPKSHFLLRTVNPTLPGADEHNTFVEKAKNGAFRLLGADATPQELAEASVKSQMADRYRDLYLEARKREKTLLSRLGDTEASEPDVLGRTPPKKSPEEALLDESPGDIYRRLIST